MFEQVPLLDNICLFTSLGQTHYSRGHIGQTHCSRGHIGQTHCSRGHICKTHCSRGPIGQTYYSTTFTLGEDINYTSYIYTHTYIHTHIYTHVHTQQSIWVEIMNELRFAIRCNGSAKKPVPRRQVM